MQNVVTNDRLEATAAQKIAALISKWCGVDLNEQKQYLIASRLKPLLTEFQLAGFEELIAASSGTNVRLRERVIDAVTTHETLFFRDNSPFAALASQIIPEQEGRQDNRKRSLSIWSAACSSGQEPYSLAMQLCESIKDISSWRIKILATDVSPGTVAYAKQGVYMSHELRRGLSPEMQSRYFVQSGENWMAGAKLKSMIQFQIGNLVGPNNPTGPFDVIFCRNVLIYFNAETKQKVLRNLASRLTPEGRLFVGCSEVLSNVGDFLRRERIGHTSCYMRA